jgi:stage II sporulation protein AA (anti-sigma F factor antagonist)
MQTEYITQSKTLVVRLNGELDHHTSEMVRRRVDGDIQRLAPRRVIFDFSGLKFMDSSGIGVIMGRYKNIQRSNGIAAMVNVRPEVKKVFDISGVTKLIPQFDNIDQALKSI